jgi:signal transduction histidine kinase
MSLEPVRWREIFDTIEESGLSDLVLVASHICSTPVALITLVEDASQWFKAQIGISLDGGWETSFCAHAARQSDVFVAVDALKDARFSDHPLARGNPNVRFYAGTPLVASNAATIGTLCVMDIVARQLTGNQAAALRVLAAQVVGQLELRRHVIELKRTEAALTQREEQLRESQRQLERADALRREMVANVSHDLRTPLALLQGHLDTLLLKHAVSRDEQRRYLEIAARQGERLGHADRRTVRVGAARVGRDAAALRTVLVERSRSRRRPRSPVDGIGTADSPAAHVVRQCAAGDGRDRADRACAREPARQRHASHARRWRRHGRGGNAR